MFIPKYLNSDKRPSSMRQDRLGANLRNPAPAANTGAIDAQICDIAARPSDMARRDRP